MMLTKLFMPPFNNMAGKTQWGGSAPGPQMHRARSSSLSDEAAAITGARAVVHHRHQQMNPADAFFAPGDSWQ